MLKVLALLFKTPSRIRTLKENFNLKTEQKSKLSGTKAESK